MTTTETPVKLTLIETTCYRLDYVNHRGDSDSRTFTSLDTAKLYANGLLLNGAKDLTITEVVIFQVQ